MYVCHASSYLCAKLGVFAVSAEPSPSSLQAISSGYLHLHIILFS